MSGATLKTTVNSSSVITLSVVSRIKSLVDIAKHQAYGQGELDLGGGGRRGFGNGYQADEKISENCLDVELDTCWPVRWEDGPGEIHGWCPDRGILEGSLDILNRFRIITL